MKKLILVLFLALNFIFQARAQYKDIIVISDDIDSCDIIRPDVVPDKLEISDAGIYFAAIYNKDKSYWYPEEAIKNHISGTVLCTFRVTKDCKITDYKICKSLGYGLDDVALKYVSLMKRPTSPAEYQGKKVDVLCMYVQEFTIYPAAWSTTIAKDFSMEKLLDEEAILVDAESQDRRSITDPSELDYSCRVPYVRFKVKHRNGKIAKVRIEKSSGFQSLDTEAMKAVWSVERWEKGRLQKDAVYIVPVRFDPNLQPLEDTENQDE